MKTERTAPLVIFESVVVGVACCALAWGLARAPAGSLEGDLFLWGAVVAVVELLPVSAWRGMQISVSFPVLVAVAFLYPPAAAGLVAMVASVDPRELRREVSFLRAAFNRSQISLAVMAASLVFHRFASLDGSARGVFAAALLAVTADYAVNVLLVTAAGSLMFHVNPREVLKKMKIGNPVEFLVSYLGLGALGMVLAKLYLDVGFWAVAVFIVPLIFARQMFFRSRALEEAHDELEDRATLLRQLSNRMAEERQDERSQIAAYLHDDLAQVLFRLSLQVDLADRLLQQGDVDQVRQTLAEIKETKSDTSDKIRSLIRDLHRSPLGRAGLAEALSSFAGEVSAGAATRVELRVDDLPLPPPIQLLAYQIAREAIMNALKYADATTIEVEWLERGAHVELSIHDDGKGFDAEAGEPDGHYGLTMMRERAVVAGGTFDLVSASGHGTNITVRFPGSWLQPASASGVPTDDPVDLPAT
jgi:signal transduction histidine kinase